MIVVMKPVSTSTQVDHVVKLVREMGLKEHVIVGDERTGVACVGNERLVDKGRLELADGVDNVMPVLASYKMASSEVKKDRTVIPLGGKLGGTVGGKKIPVIAGPCSVESKQQIIDVAHQVKA